MAGKKKVEGTKDATFRLTEETLKRLEKYVLLKKLEGEEVYKSQIVENALREYLDKIEKEIKQ